MKGHDRRVVDAIASVAEGKRREMKRRVKCAVIGP